MEVGSAKWIILLVAVVVLAFLGVIGLALANRRWGPS